MKHWSPLAVCLSSLELEAPCPLMGRWRPGMTFNPPCVKEARKWIPGAYMDGNCAGSRRRTSGRTPALAWSGYARLTARMMCPVVNSPSTRWRSRIVCSPRTRWSASPPPRSTHLVNTGFRHYQEGELSSLRREPCGLAVPQPGKLKSPGPPCPHGQGTIERHRCSVREGDIPPAGQRKCWTNPRRSVRRHRPWLGGPGRL